MVNAGKFTAFCRLYCEDCIPSHKGLFEIAGALDELLNELSPGEYAAMKADGNPFCEYPAFARVLSEIRALECMGRYLNDGCKSGCKQIWQRLFFIGQHRFT